jgi:hypothetical protein
VTRAGCARRELVELAPAAAVSSPRLDTVMEMSVCATIADGRSVLVGHHPMGVSTGVFEDRRGCWRELVAEACSISTYAVELSALSEDELPGLITYLAAKPRLPFRYVSVHAPVKDRDLDDAAGAQLLNELPLWVRSIVTHPDVLAEPAHYRELGTRLVPENMDDRKRAGRTADELEVVFAELPEAGFCLDVAHASSIDPTMEAAEDLLNRFRSRLRQVHLSSLEGGHHVPSPQTMSSDSRQFSRVAATCHGSSKPGRPSGGWTS